MLGQRAHQTFHRLVRHQTHPYPARVLQPGSEEMDPLAGAIAELHFHLPKIVLTEIPREDLRSEPAASPVSNEARPPAHRALSFLLDSRFPELAAESLAMLDPAFPAESRLP